MLSLSRITTNLVLKDDIISFLASNLVADFFLFEICLAVYNECNLLNKCLSRRRVFFLWFMFKSEREEDRNVCESLFDCFYSKIIKKDLKGFHFY